MLLSWKLTKQSYPIQYHTNNIYMILLYLIPCHLCLGMTVKKSRFKTIIFYIISISELSFLRGFFPGSKHNIVLQNPSLVAAFFFNYIVKKSFLYQATIKIMIKKLFFSWKKNNKNISDSIFYMPTLHWKERKLTNLWRGFDTRKVSMYKKEYI